MIRWRFTDRNNQYEDVFLNYNAETDTYEEYKPYAIVHCETKEDFDRMQQALKEQKLGGWNNQWISVEDDLPCNHDELFINDDKKETKTVLSIINGYIMMSRMYKPKRKWCWDSEEQPTHWMPIPELPKE